MTRRREGKFLFDFVVGKDSIIYSAHEYYDNNIKVYWYRDDLSNGSIIYNKYEVQKNIDDGAWIKIINDGNDIRKNSEFAQKVTKTFELERKTYLVDVKSEDDAFVVDVFWSINLPNNPSYDDLIAEWVLENFGETPYEYYSLADLKRKEISYY